MNIKPKNSPKILQSACRARRRVGAGFGLFLAALAVLAFPAFAKLVNTGIIMAGGSSSTDTALVRFSGTSGSLVQDSAVVLSSTALSPGVNDGVALGTTSLKWADAFFATGANIDFNAGDVKIRHSLNTLFFEGVTSGNLFDDSVVAGHTAELAVNGNTSRLQAFGTTAGLGSVSIGAFSTTDSEYPSINFLKSGSGTIGSSTVVASGEALGQIDFIGAQQTGTFATQFPGVSIRAYVDGTVTSGASGDMPGRLEFYTAADGSGTPTERFEINNAGQLTFLVNDTDTSFSGTFSDAAKGLYGRLSLNPGSASSAITTPILGENVWASSNSATGTGHSVGVFGRTDFTGSGDPVWQIPVEGRCDTTGTGVEDAVQVTTCTSFAATAGVDTGSTGNIGIYAGFYLGENSDDANVGTSAKFSLFSDDADYTLRNDGNATVGGTLVVSRTTDIGWSLVSAANQACNTTCTNACVHGWNTAAGEVAVSCTDATADKCLCAGGS